MKRDLPYGLIEDVRKWLGGDGRDLFLTYYKEHGTVSPVLSGEGMPHPVHFREGMQVRNFMRKTGLCEDWNAHDYDDNWQEVVRKAIGMGGSHE
jgi:hypothetical protein